MLRPDQGNRLQKHTMHLFEGDYEILRELYPEIGAAIVIRGLVRKFINQVEDRTPGSPNVEINI